MRTKDHNFLVLPGLKRSAPLQHTFSQLPAFISLLHDLLSPPNRPAIAFTVASTRMLGCKQKDALAAFAP